MPGGQDDPDKGTGQLNQADRDVYAAARDQTVINASRRVEMAAGWVPHPAAVGRAGPVTGLPRRPVRVFQSALVITEAALGPDHPDTAYYLSNLALTYTDLGRHADALPLKERAGQIRQRPR